MSLGASAGRRDGIHGPIHGFACTETTRHVLVCACRRAARAPTRVTAAIRANDRGRHRASDASSAPAAAIMGRAIVAPRLGTWPRLKTSRATQGMAHRLAAHGPPSAPWEVEGPQSHIPISVLPDTNGGTHRTRRCCHRVSWGALARKALAYKHLQRPLPRPAAPGCARPGAARRDRRAGRLKAAGSGERPWAPSTTREHPVRHIAACATHEGQQGQCAWAGCTPCQHRSETLRGDRPSRLALRGPVRLLQLVDVGQPQDAGDILP